MVKWVVNLHGGELLSQQFGFGLADFSIWKMFYVFARTGCHPEKLFKREFKNDLDESFKSSPSGELFWNLPFIFQLDF